SKCHNTEIIDFSIRSTIKVAIYHIVFKLILKFTNFFKNFQKIFIEYFTWKDTKKKNFKLTQDYEQLIKKIKSSTQRSKQERNRSIFTLSQSAFAFHLLHNSNYLKHLLETLVMHGMFYSTFDNCQFICSGSYDKTIRIWDIETTKQFNVFKGHEYVIRSVKYGSNELMNT
ncbi:WD repeat-containing protein, partial [Reticulomyxa filosa]